MRNLAYLSLGSNMGERLFYMREATRLLDNHPECKVSGISSLYETAPVGYTEQEDFLNAVLQINTSLQPEELLNLCQEIEQELGRKRIIRWGPRTLDIDILLFNHENIETERLSVPHPRMLERAFVIVPLLELDPDITLPTTDTPLLVILDNSQDKEGVRLWKQKNGEDVFVLFES